MNKLYALIFMIVSTCLLPIGFVKLPSIITPSTVFLYFSAIAGYVGVSMLLWEYILGSRTVSKYLNIDYSKILKIHRWIGKYGTLLIFTHPFLVTISYGELILYNFIPNLSNTFDTSVTLGRTAFYILALIWLTSFILRDKLKYRPWKYIHLLSYLMIPLVLLHIPLTGSGYATSLLTKLYFFTILFGFAIFTYFRSYSWLGLDKKEYNVLSHQAVNDKVFILSMQPTNLNEKITLQPGQYVHLKINKIGENHPFSVLSQDADGVIKIAYKVYGSYTKKLSAVKPGQKLLISGPFGDFLGDMNESDINVFIAGGIGITPFISSIFKDSKNKFVFYANHSPETAVFVNSIQKIIGENLTNIYSVVNGQTLVTRDKQGEVLIKSLTDKLPQPTTCKYYICGPEPQVMTYEKALIDFGVPKSSINCEIF